MAHPPLNLNQPQDEAMQQEITEKTKSNKS